ncbi:MAG: GIY-YIG nuclease family protein [Nitrospirae bacterium]|nr:GIY-YIG nuclease family protein [Nitrospirota bacterium]
MKQYYVYIMTNRSKTLYTGVTNNLERRVYEHKNKLVAGFTSKYNIDRLVYFEATQDINSAIAREKQLKGWLRAKKVALIEASNPEWQDLSSEWLEKKKTDSSASPQNDRKSVACCPVPFFCHSESFACHSEQSEEFCIQAQDKLREESDFEEPRK